jgi:hypothetical protein
LISPSDFVNSTMHLTSWDWKRCVFADAAMGLNLCVGMSA